MRQISATNIYNYISILLLSLFSMYQDISFPDGEPPSKKETK